MEGAAGHWQTGERRIIFCPLHEAAPKLLKACKDMQKFYTFVATLIPPGQGSYFREAWDRLRRAINEAEKEVV